MFKKTADLVEGGTPISTLVGQRDWAMAIVWFLVLWRLASSLALNIHRGQPSHRVGEKDISLKILPELQAPPIQFQLYHYDAPDTGTCSKALHCPEH